MTILPSKRWIIGDMTDFDVFCNLRNSGVEITVTQERKEVVANIHHTYYYAGKRQVEAITTTPEQETLLLLSCTHVSLIEETTPIDFS